MYRPICPLTVSTSLTDFDGGASPTSMRRVGRRVSLCPQEWLASQVRIHSFALSTAVRHDALVHRSLPGIKLASGDAVIITVSDLTALYIYVLAEQPRRTYHVQFEIESLIPSYAPYPPCSPPRLP